MPKLITNSGKLNFLTSYDSYVSENEKLIIQEI